MSEYCSTSLCGPLSAGNVSNSVASRVSNGPISEKKRRRVAAEFSWTGRISSGHYWSGGSAARSTFAQASSGRCWSGGSAARSTFA